MALDHARWTDAVTLMLPTLQQDPHKSPWLTHRIEEMIHGSATHADHVYPYRLRLFTRPEQHLGLLSLLRLAPDIGNFRDDERHLINDAAIEMADTCLEDIKDGTELQTVSGLHDRLPGPSPIYPVLYELNRIKTTSDRRQSKTIDGLTVTAVRQLMQENAGHITGLANAMVDRSYPLFRAGDRMSRIVAHELDRQYPQTMRQGRELASLYTDNLHIMTGLGLRNLETAMEATRRLQGIWPFGNFFRHLDRK